MLKKNSRFWHSGAGLVINHKSIIGDNVQFSPQVLIGGANAVVTKDVEPFTIVGGVPAKVIGHITKENYHRYQGCFPFSKNPFE